MSVTSSGKFLGRCREAAQQERFAVTEVPPVAAGVGLIPVVADARLAGAAVVEEDGRLADLGPVHRDTATRAG